MLTKRQKAYRVYLQTDHWKELRQSALDRDGGKCVVCDSDLRLQVHHKIYRGRLEDGILDDVETLCRKCHRLEHGFGGPTDFELKSREFSKFFGHGKRPPPALWQELKALMFNDADVQDFGDLMFKFVNEVLADEKERQVEAWWMDKEKRDFWWYRARSVRESIQSRITTNVREIV